MVLLTAHFCLLPTYTQSSMLKQAVNRPNMNSPFSSFGLDTHITTNRCAANQIVDNTNHADHFLSDIK